MTPKQKGRLDKLMPNLDLMWSRRHVYGGREVTQMQDFKRRFNMLVNPEDPDALAAEIEAFSQANLKYVAMRQEQGRAAEDAQKIVEAARAEAHRAHAERQEAEIKRKRDYQAEAIVARNAIDEQIG
jgi:hypothetical protein